MKNFIKELKSRTILLIICWLTVFIILCYYKSIIFFEILQPTANGNTILNYFIFTKITELFKAYFELILFLNNQIFIFYLLFNCLYFISPGLYCKEYKQLHYIFKLILKFWFFSLFFLNYYIIPFIWNFFFKFQNNLLNLSIHVQFEAKISDYIKFFIKTYYVCNLQFQTVVIITLTFLNKNKTYIKRYKKFFYFLFLLIATFITPPDFVAQILIYLGLIIFFEFTLFIYLILNKLIR